MMKRIAKYIVIIMGSIAIFICMLLLFFVLGISGCLHAVDTAYEAQEKVYYSNAAYFITSTGIVEYMSIDEDDEYIGFALDEIDERYEDVRFAIRDENYDIAIKNSISKKIAVGDEIQFTSAPGYFGDGYIMPIVALSVDGEELLSFEEGYKNLLDSYD